MTTFRESYGRDIRLDINLPGGTVLTLPEIIDYHLTPKTHMDHFVLLNGRPVNNAIPQGGEGTIDLKRVDSTVENFQAQFEANFYSGAPQLKGTLTETINNPDGTVTQYQCQGVILLIEDMGQWKGETAVTQKIKFHYEVFTQLA